MQPTLTERLSVSLYATTAEPGDTPRLKTYKILTVASMMVGAPALLVWAFIFLYFAEIETCLIMITYAVYLVILLSLLRLRWVRFWLSLNLFLGAHLAINFLATLALGGIVNSTGLFLYGLLGPFGMATHSRRQFIGWFAASVALVILEVALQPWLRSSNQVPLNISTLFWGVNFISVGGFLFGNLLSVLGQRDTALELLQAEQAKSENLLLNILPPEIARVLKNENRTVAEYIEQASIMFADVVNFTPMSATMSPTELVSLLNEVFSQFDMLVEKYDLEKIKTIGDCYMVAAGVPRPRPDHAQALAQLALDIQAYVSQNKIQGRQLQFRIGINSGPVVAGVIGRRKFIYDLWGDAVNTASRMESHGAGGIIQITPITYELIKSEFRCEPRGRVNVKGKGEMDVWQIMGYNA